MKKIVLLCQQIGCPFELSPARYQLLDELLERNYEVYVLFPGYIPNKTMRDKIDCFVNTEEMSEREIRNRIRQISPASVIAFTYEDARILYQLPLLMKNTNFYYYNLEIYTWAYEKRAHRAGIYGFLEGMLTYIANKTNEIRYVKNTKLFVIQDELRKKVSQKHFIRHKHTMLIPNSYVFDKDNLCGEEANGVCYSGGLYSVWTGMLSDGIEKVSRTPITFAGWGSVSFSKKISKMPNMKVVFQQLLPDEYDAFLKQYAVGLICYSEIEDDNVNFIGMASGKYFKYLSLGQPVIAMHCLGMEKDIKRYGLGIVIDDVSKLDEAYEQIISNYRYYRDNVRRVYREKYDYKKVIRPFLEYLEKQENDK